MPSREDLTLRQVIDVVTGDDVASRHDLLRQSIEEAAGPLLRVIKDEAQAAALFPPEDFARFEELLGYSFPPGDAWLARAALTTKDFRADSLGQSSAAQRLAWIGDSKIYDVNSEALVAAFPTAAISDFSIARVARIKRVTLAGAARAVGADRLLLLGKSFVGQYGAAGARDNLSKAMLGEAFEAVLGAVALSGGLEAVRRCYFRRVPLPTTLARLQQETAEMNADP